MQSRSAKNILGLFWLGSSCFCFFSASRSMPGPTVADVDKGLMVKCLQTYLLHAEAPSSGDATTS